MAYVKNDSDPENIALQEVAEDVPPTSPVATDNILATAHLSAASCAMYVQFAVTLSLSTSLYPEGAVYLGVCYYTFAFGSLFFGPYVVQRLGCRRTFQSMSFAYTATTLSMFWPKWYCLGIAVANVGFCSAFYWNAQAGYISHASTHATIGRHQGVFWMFFQSSFLIGNFLSSTILKLSSMTVLLAVLSLLGCCASVAFLFLPVVDDSALARQGHGLHPADTLRAIAALAARSSTLRWMVLPYGVSGFTIAFVQSWFSANVVNPVFGIDGIGYVMMAGSLTNAAVCVVAGAASDKFGRAAVFTVTVGSTLLGVTVLGARTTLGIGEYPHWVYYGVSSLFGMGYAGLFTINNALVGTRLKNDISGAVGLCRTVQGVCAATSLTFLHGLPDGVVQVTSIVAYASAIWCFRRAENSIT